MPDSARNAALYALERCRRGGAWSPAAIDGAAEKFALDRRDTAFVSRLTLCALENFALCDHYIGAYCTLPVKRLEPAVLDILRLGVCQILFMLADLEGFRKNQAAAEVQSHLMETAPGVAPISARGEMPKEKYRQRKKRSRKVTILSGVFGVLLLIIAVFVFLWNFWLKSLFTESQRVEVPDFQGKMYEDVLNDSQYKGKYNFKMIIKVDTEHEYGYILSQTPEAGKSMVLRQKGRHRHRQRGRRARRGQRHAGDIRRVTFFHPDCTVGTGVAPVQLSLADFTADREFHPALKTLFHCQPYYTRANAACKVFSDLLYYGIKSS